MQITLTVDPETEVEGPLLKSIIKLADKGEANRGVLPTGKAAAALVAWARKDSDPEVSASLVRGLAVVACFGLDEVVASGATDLSITEISRFTHLSMSTTHRYVKTWVRCGVLFQDSRTRRYAPKRQFNLNDGPVAGQ
ncbi:MAG TPA: helix-turn-helix domain-containing protein [Candidatus Saccharimonadales bacterium]|nr:helix-turn-helix domain-containing protein [Candidatus Saccharimonadales bacterium]